MSEYVRLLFSTKLAYYSSIKSEQILLRLELFELILKALLLVVLE